MAGAARPLSGLAVCTLDLGLVAWSSDLEAWGAIGVPILRGLGLVPVPLGVSPNAGLEKASPWLV